MRRSFFKMSNNDNKVIFDAGYERKKLNLVIIWWIPLLWSSRCRPVRDAKH